MQNLFGEVSEQTFRLVWKVPEFPFLSVSPNVYYDSPPFKCYGAIWYLRLYAGGHGNICPGFVTVYLMMMAGTPPKQVIDWEIGITDSYGHKYMSKKAKCQITLMQPFGCDLLHRDQILQHIERFAHDRVLILCCEISK